MNPFGTDFVPTQGLYSNLNRALGVKFTILS